MQFVAEMQVRFRDASVRYGALDALLTPKSTLASRHNLSTMLWQSIRQAFSCHASAHFLAFGFDVQTLTMRQCLASTNGTDILLSWGG
eukprot:2152633-Rhodomonas_salina.2